MFIIIESQYHNKPRKPLTTGPKPYQLKTPLQEPNPRSRPQNLNPQTTTNEQKWEKKV